MRDYGKLLWAVLGAVVFAVQAVVTDGMSASDWVGVAVAATVAFVTWAAPDTTLAPWVKSAAGGAVAGLLVLQTAVTHWPLTGSDWVAVVVALLTGAGVVVDPRRPVRGVRTVDVRPAA